MDSSQLIERLTVALAIGLVIGIERGWKQREEAEGDRAAGLRTHALAGLLGGIWGALTVSFGEGGVIALALAFSTFAGAMTFFRYREMVHDESYGATTVVAVMLAFALGAFAVVGDVTAAAAAGVATALLLALKSALHEWVKRLTWEELRAGLILAAMTVILLPLLPDRALSQWFPANLREVWLLTILIAAFSFAGYVAIRYAGPQVGVLLSGIAGGLVSSTAVTLSMARLAHEYPERRRLFASAIMLSSAIMMLRVIVLVAIVNVALLEFVALPLVLAAAAQALIAGYFADWTWEEGPPEKPLELKNPFDLVTVLQFGALLAVIMAVAQLMAEWWGSQGAIGFAAISGLADVDAVSLSLARLAPDGLSASSAAIAILVAVVANSVAKIGLGITAGGLALGRLLGWALAAALAAGALGFAAALQL